jgi:hypothetical protein
MTDQEFRVWLSYVKDQSPMLTEWLASLSDTVRLGLARRWFNALQGCELRAAENAADVIINDPADRLRFVSDRELLAVRVAEIVSAMRSKESEAARVANMPKRAPRRQGEQASEGRRSIMDQVEHAIATDARHDDACREHRSRTKRCRFGCPVPRLVAREIGQQLQPAAGRQYGDPCERCRGTGHALILNPAAITEEFLDGGPLVRREQTVYCLCSLGQALSRGHEKNRSKQSRMKTFDARTMIAIGNETDDDLRVAAHAWRESAGGKRFSEFDEFSSGGF